MALLPEYKKRLVSAAMRMEQDGLPPEEIQAQVDRFKNIYDPDARPDESDFRAWYQEKSIENDLNPNPDDPQHFYNYRAAFRSGAEPDQTGHWPSKYKLEGHPNLVMDGVDTRTNQAPDWETFLNPTPYFEQFQKTALAPKRSAQVTAAPTTTEEVPVENVRTEQMQLQGPAKQPEIMEPAQVTAGNIQKPFIGDIKEAAKSFARNLITAPRALQEMQDQEDFKRLVDMQKKVDELTAANSAPDKIIKLQKTIDRDSKNLQFNTKAVNWLKSLEESKILKPQEVERLPGVAGFVQDVAQGLTQIGGQFLAQAINPNLGAAAIAGQITGNTISTLEQYGVDKKEAAPLAILNAAIQYPLEKVGMGKIAKNVLKSSAPVIKKLVSSFIGEGGTEAVEQIPDDVFGKMWGETKGQTIEERVDYLKKHLGEIVKDAGYAGLIGGIVGSTATGAAHPVAKIAGYPKETVPVSPEAPAVSEKQPIVSPEAVNVPTEVPTPSQTVPTGGTVRTGNEGAEVQAPEAETIKIPIVPGNQQVVKKSEGTTQTYVPKEQGSIIPPKTPEAPNVQQEEKGKLQVAPEEKPAGKARSLTFQEFEQLSPEEKQNHYEMNPATQRPGQNGFNRVFQEKTENLTKPIAVATGDINGFKEYNDRLLGSEATDAYNSQLFDVIEKHAGKGNVFNIHGDEYMVIGENPAQIQNALKSSMEEIASKPFKGKDGKDHKTTMTWMVTTTSDPKYLGDLPLKAAGKNQIAVDKSLGKAYTSIKGSESVADNEIVRRSEVKDENDISGRLPGKPETGRAVPEPTQGISTVTGTQAAPTQAAPTPAQEVTVRPAPPAPIKEESRTGKTVPAIPTEEKKAPQQPSAPEPSAKKEINTIGKLVVDAIKEQKSAIAKAKGKLPKSISKRIVVKSSKTPPGSAKKLMNDKGDWEAAVWYNPEGKVVEVHINENLPADLYAEALYHEIPGHIGQRLVFADSPAILNTMRQMYGAAKTRKDVDLEGIRKAYKSDIENAGERGDDVLFEEWTAHNLHRYLIENDKASIPARIYNLFRSALVKIGVVKENIDDVLRSMVKRMKKAKDVGVLERGLKESFKRPVEEGKEVGPVGPVGPVGQNEKAAVKSIVEGESTPDEVTLDIPPETRYQAFRRVVTDRQYRLFKLMKGAEEQTGKELPDELNAYVMNDIFNSKAEARIKEFRETYIEPIEKLMVKNGLSVKTVDQYNYAKHAEEANRVVGERRPDMIEAGKPPSGMSNEKAQQILNEAKTSGKQSALEEISGIIQKWNKARLDLRVEYGLMTEEQRDALLEQFKNYVPLKGVHEKVEGKDEVEEEIIPRVGKGLNVPRRNFYMRKGRETEAGDILANLIKDSADTVMIGEKNVIDNALYKFAKEFKSDLIVAEPVVFEKYFDKKSGIFKERKKTNFTVDDMTKYGLPLNFKVDGEPMQMLIKDKLLMKGLANAGAQSSENITKLLTKGILPVMRYLSIVRTQLAVNFPISNFMRDAMTGLLNTVGLNLTEEQKTGLAKDIMKDVLPAVGWAYQGLTGKKTEGAAKFNEFLKSGGAVSFLEFKDAATLQRELVNRIKLMGPGAGKIPQKLLRNAYEYITTLNGSVENAYRLATYQQLVKGNKKSGREPLSSQKSAHIAKNITVNFNKKGELGPYLNAWAIFGNANIQGSVRILNTLAHSKTVRGIAAGIIAASFGWAELMRYIAGDDPDDGENYYDKINDFTKDTHIVIPLGNLEKSEDKPGIRLPLAYGYNIFWAAGQILNKMAHTEDKAKAIPQAALRMAGVIVDAFNPFGRSIVPTLMQPYFDIETNKDFMGAPVYKESKSGYGPQPTFSHSSLKKTPETMKKTTELASELTGGGKYTKGAFDALGKYSSPDVMNYLFNFATGGVGKLGADLASLPYEWVSNKEIPIKRIPVAQRFYTEINEYQDVKKLYDNLDKVRRVYLDYKEYQESDPKRAKKMEYEYPAILSMMRKTEVERTNKNMEERKTKIIPLNDRIIKPLKRMNEIKKEYEEKDNKEGVKRIEKLIVNHSQTWNKRLDKMLNPPNIKPEKKP